MENFSIETLDIGFKPNEELIMALTIEQIQSNMIYILSIGVVFGVMLGCFGSFIFLKYHWYKDKIIICKKHKELKKVKK